MQYLITNGPWIRTGDCSILSPIVPGTTHDSIQFDNELSKHKADQRSNKTSTDTGSPYYPKWKAVASKQPCTSCHASFMQTCTPHNRCESVRSQAIMALHGSGLSFMHAISKFSTSSYAAEQIQSNLSHLPQPARTDCRVVADSIRLHFGCCHLEVHRTYRRQHYPCHS